MLSRFGYYSWWAVRFAIAIAILLVASHAQTKYVPKVPWIPIEVVLFVVLFGTILRGPIAYSAYVSRHSRSASNGQAR